MSMATKKALVVGLNYPGTSKPLKCSVRNAKKVKNYLVKYFEFQSENITILTDDDSGRSEQSTIQITAYDICKQLSMLIEDAKDQDILFYYFCGHGGSYKAREYANNSGYVEYMVGSGKTRFKDTTFRDFVETVPTTCSFTSVVDCCRSGAILEGANEVIGNSTRNPSIYIDRAPKDKRFQVGIQTGRRLGILISSCQNYQSSKQKYYKRGREYGTRSFLDVIKETKGNISNLELVQLTGQKMVSLLAKYEEADRHNPGLYCDNSQKDLMFLSHEVKVIENEDDDDVEA